VLGFALATVRYRQVLTVPAGEATAPSWRYGSQCG